MGAITVTCVDAGGTNIFQGNNMKLLALTLAAVSMLAAASAQAELQTWRFMDAEGIDGPAGTFIDISFDIDARIDVVSDDSLQYGSRTFEAWINPIANWTFKGITYTPTSNNWITTETAPLVIWQNQSIAPNEPRELTFAALDRSGLFDGQGHSLAEALERFSDRVRLNNQLPPDVPGMSRQPMIWVTRTFPGLQTVDGIVVTHMTRVPSVPEPSSWALALLGGMSGAALARRRQTAHQLS